MARHYLAFDIETAKDVPGEDFNWRPHRPLGITCIASQSTTCPEPRVWLTRGADGQPAPKMSRDDVVAFVRYLVNAVSEGICPISWNGMGFDFDILSEESGLVDECKSLARSHVDMMFHVVCVKGFPVSLSSAALGLRVPGKKDGVSGISAPTLWAQGQHDLVMEYVSQDVRTTLAVAAAAEKKKSFVWITRKGTPSTMPLPNGWLAVCDALKLELPDVSWMPNPPKRKGFTAWME